VWFRTLRTQPHRRQRGWPGPGPCNV